MKTYVYVAADGPTGHYSVQWSTNDNGDDIKVEAVKIGKAENICERLYELNCEQSKSIWKYRVIKLLEITDGNYSDVETHFHKVFIEKRLNGEKRTEFFEMGNDVLNETTLRDAINDYCDTHDNVQEIDYNDLLENNIRTNLKNNNPEYLNKKVILHSEFNARRNRYSQRMVSRCENVANRNVTVQELYDLELNIGGTETIFKIYARNDLVYDICKRKLLDLE